MGAMVHGFQIYGYTYIPYAKAGNNMTIEVLHRVLCDQRVKRGNTLPNVLLLQLDNTSKQCKGRFVLGYLALLVTWDVFVEVVLSFLPVGHTHEDIGAEILIFAYVYVFSRSILFSSGSVPSQTRQLVEV